MSVTYIFIEGNIGAGKSTLLAHLARDLTSLLVPRAYTHVLYVPEPLEAWRAIRYTSNGSTHVYNVLDAFYSDQRRYAFTFQAHALATRIRAVRDAITAIAQPDARILCICERSVYTDRYVFVEMLARAGTLSALEHAVYNEWWRHWHSQLYPGTIGGVVHITTPPEQCATYMNVRDRSEETGVTLEYLRDLHTQHVHALSGLSEWARAPRLSLTLHNTWTRADTSRAAIQAIAEFIAPVHE